VSTIVVGRRQRRLCGVDEMVLSLSAKGLTTGEIAGFFAETYRQAMSKDTISRTARLGGRGDDRVGEPAAVSGAMSNDCCESCRGEHGDGSGWREQDAAVGEAALLRVDPAGSEWGRGG
jgi:Transposase, Mutator family